MNDRINFYDKETGCKLLTISLAGNFPGEVTETKKLLAHERHIPVDNIVAVTFGDVVIEAIRFNREWKINNKQDLIRAIQILAGNDFCAEMSDSYQITLSEQAEVARQRSSVLKQAKEKGII